MRDAIEERVREVMDSQDVKRVLQQRLEVERKRIEEQVSLAL